MDFVPRRQVGPYRIVAHLDSGGMADVYLARGSGGPQDLVVVKVLLEDLKSVPVLNSMFRDEARILLALEHSNIVRGLETGEVEGLPYLTMEYLAGDNLGILRRSARRQGIPLGPGALAVLFRKVAGALTYIHGFRAPSGLPLDLVHRDISPQNIFLCYDGRVVLLDFGVAQATDRETQTRSGVLKGKVAYMSPEQVRQQPLDGRSDVFSFGVVMWEMCADHRLFRRSNDFDSMSAICQQDPAPLSELRPDLPARLTDLVHLCLTRDLERRPTSAEVEAELVDLGHSLRKGAAEEELVALSRRVLENRRRDKQNMVEALRREQVLQIRLFGDLEDDAEGSDSDGARPLIAARRVLKTSAMPLSRKPPASITSRGSADSPRSRRRGWLVAIVVLALSLLIAVGVWLVFFRIGAGPEWPAPSTVLTTTHPLRGKTGGLWLRSMPAARVQLDGRELGNTPLRRRDLVPGRHRLVLEDEAEGERREMKIDLKAGEEIDLQLVF